MYKRATDFYLPQRVSLEIRQSLQVKWRSSHGFAWWLAGEPWIASTCAAEQHILDPADIEGIEILKQYRNRFVFRMRTECDFRSVVVKSFYMKNFRQQIITHTRYGSTEAQHLLHAARLGLPVPTLYGLGIQRRYGLVYHSALMMEDLTPMREMWYWLQQSVGQVERQQALLKKAGTLVLAMYRAGCYQIDMNYGGILLGPEPSDLPKIIDWQYVRFFDQPCDQSLIIHAAYFGHNCVKWMPREIIDEWCRWLMKTSGIKDPDAGWKRYNELFEKITKMSRKERFKLIK
jgi:tRNA A-37 threonylcarbamoyl transferase component Bud32